MNKSQKLWSMKETRQKRVYSVWFHLYSTVEKCKLNYSYRKQISDGQKGLQWGMRKFLRVIVCVPYLACDDGFIYVYDKRYQNIQFKYVYAPSKAV